MSYIAISKDKAIKVKNQIRIKEAKDKITATVQSTGTEQIVIPEPDQVFDKVVVTPLALQDKEALIALEEQVIMADEGYSGLNSVKVKGMNESVIDLNLNTLDFKEGDVEILPKTTIVEEVISTTDHIDLSTVDKCGCTYGFNLNSNGQLVPTNKGYHNTYSYGRLDFSIPEDGGSFTVKMYQSSEANYDYGQLSLIDTALSKSSSPDSSVAYNAYGKSGTLTYTYTNVSKGEHFITFKYRKDGSANSGSDEWRIDSITGLFGTIERNEYDVDATALTKVTIKKPKDLVGENIKSGINLFGVEGTHVCNENWVDRTVEDMDLSSGQVELGPKFSILGDKTLRYTEIDLSTFEYDMSTAYDFIYNSESGWLENNNEQIHNTYVWAKFEFDILETSDVKFELYQNCEEFYDYGMLSKLDEDLSKSNIPDDSYAWSGKGLEGNLEYTYKDVPAGKHTISIKYIKDDRYTSKLGDKFAIKAITTPVGAFGYNYVDDLPIDGDALKKVFIKKPETLIPENIIKDVTIFGVTGSYEGIIPEGEMYIDLNGEYDVHNLSKVKVDVRTTDLSNDFHMMRAFADMYRVLGDVEATWTDEEITETLDEYGIYRNKVLGIGE